MISVTGFSVQPGIHLQTHQIADGGERVFGVDGQFRKRGQIEILANSRAAGNPGDVPGARIIGTVGPSGTAMIGADQDKVESRSPS